VAGGKLVKQRALHLGAGEARGFLLKLAAQQAAQLLERFETERLGEIIVALLSPATFTALTVMSKVASLPFRFSAG
jgi:hypothetical protein